MDAWATDALIRRPPNDRSCSLTKAGRFQPTAERWRKGEAFGSDKTSRDCEEHEAGLRTECEPETRDGDKPMVSPGRHGPGRAYTATLSPLALPLAAACSAISRFGDTGLSSTVTSGWRRERSIDKPRPL